MVQLRKSLLRTNVADSSSLPYLNSMFIEHHSLFSQSGNTHSYKTFVKWFRKTPQLVGFMNIIATDIVSDGMRFIPTDDERSGRNRVIRSKKFMMENRGEEHLESMLYDFLWLGVGYHWIGLRDEREMREFSRIIASNSFQDLELKELEYKTDEVLKLISNGEISSRAKKLRHIPASTLNIKNNVHEIEGYVQTVGQNSKIFSREEVIQYNLMPYDGKVYPYPPAESLIAEIYLLWLITQNYVSLFENGGHPDKVFILPKEMANSKNHKFLINTLKKYKKVQNKHGNLVFAGDIKIEDMMKVESQMDNKDLALYVIGVLAMVWGIPAGRIPFLIGKSANSGDAGGLADSGYWRKIGAWQTKIEMRMNHQLWNPFFGVDMLFKRGYKQDEVRETQNDMQKTSVVEQRLNLGLWTVVRAGRYLDIDPEEIAAAQVEKKNRDEEEIRTGMMAQNLEKNQDVQDEQGKKNINARKVDKQKKNKMIEVST